MARIVIKIGTNTLTGENGIDLEYLDSLADQVRELRTSGHQVMLVTSGAIGAGSRHMGVERRVRKIEFRQAYAAIGQPLLMHSYQKAFQSRDSPIAQVLVTREIFNNRESYLNVRNSVETLLKMNVVPVFNENDSISTREIGPVFGDNDSLSAHVASKLDADQLIILSDIDGLYDKNPRDHEDARLIPLVEQLTEEILAMAGEGGSEFSTGGMKTKLKAVKIASRAGCQVVLAHGRRERIICRIMEGEPVGTRFLAGRRMNSRNRWIYNVEPSGTIHVDEGADRALRANKSLLPSGIVGVEGIFSSGDVVYINRSFKAVTNLSSDEIRLITGHHSRDIPKILGPDKRDDVARPEDIVILEE
ncbi:MAG: glutamate 5-kinase [Spirochaetales bacterium]|nr:glutamate 5-kinase [Spirochaetales bacterium]